MSENKTSRRDFLSKTSLGLFAAALGVESGAEFQKMEEAFDRGGKNRTFVLAELATVKVLQGRVPPRQALKTLEMFGSQLTKIEAMSPAELKALEASLVSRESTSTHSFAMIEDDKSRATSSEIGKT